MLSVIIIAISKELDKVLKLIRYENINLKCIVSGPTEDLHGILEKHHVDCKVAMYDELPEVFRDTYFDYVIVSDLDKTAGKKSRIVEDCQRLGCRDHQIINLTEFYSEEALPLYNILKNYLETDQLDAKFFITGVSHAFVATDMRCYKSPGLNLALTSQDVFLDFALAKLAMEKKKNLEKAIIGVAPFSLEYDLSQSINDYRMLMYYPIIRALHNAPLDEQNLKEIFNDAYFKAFDDFGSELVLKQRLAGASADKNISMADFLQFRTNLGYWADKYFPDTVAENKKILDDYVAMCLEKNIAPYLVIFPLTSWYNKYYSKKKFGQVKEYCAELAEKYGIPFYDLSDDERFSDSDFYDVEHLNIHGAKKVSCLLSELVGV